MCVAHHCICINGPCMKLQVWPKSGLNKPISQDAKQGQTLTRVGIHTRARPVEALDPSCKKYGISQGHV